MSMDGIAALQAKREKATRSARHVPPPRHASRPAPNDDTSGGEALSPQEPSPRRAAPAATPRPRSEPRAPKATPAPSTPEPKAEIVSETVPPASSSQPTPLVRATVYLQDTDDLWLERIAGEGRLQRPRVDASRSAVTRLALERLRQQMTGDEIVAHLAAKADASTQTVGRKRL